VKGKGKAVDYEYDDCPNKIELEAEKEKARGQLSGFEGTVDTNLEPKRDFGRKWDKDDEVDLSARGQETRRSPWKYDAREGGWHRPAPISKRGWERRKKWNGQPQQ
jgi:hypothetical protein